MKPVRFDLHFWASNNTVLQNMFKSQDKGTCHGEHLERLLEYLYNGRDGLMKSPSVTLDITANTNRKILSEKSNHK